MITENELRELKKMHKERVKEWRKKQKKIDAWIYKQLIEIEKENEKPIKKQKPKKEITKEEFEKFINEKILPNLCF